MKLSRFVHLLAVVALASVVEAASAPTIFPFEPVQLLHVLPTAPAEWTLVRSEAETALGEWVQTTATRVYQAPRAPVDVAGNPAGLPPGKVEISVVDTAGSTPALASFANFVPTKDGNFEKKLIGSLPAIVTGSEGGRQLTQVLVSSRYIVEITLTNLPRQRAEDWLRLFHFDSLPPQSKVLTHQPREFRVTHFDELRPENNRSYAVSTTNAERLHAFLKTLPASPPDLAPGKNSDTQP